MTFDECVRAFWARIDAAPADRYVTTTRIDFGAPPRGRGRRRGRMGNAAMSDPPRGERTYHRILGAAPVDRVCLEETSELSPVQQALVARALAAGECFDVAMVCAYTLEADGPSRAEAFVMATEVKASFILPERQP